MKIRDVLVKKQVQQVLLYIQEELVDIWKKENIIEYLENKSLVFTKVGEFLTDLRQEFSGGDDKTMKVAKLKNMEQKSKMVDKFV